MAHGFLVRFKRRCYISVTPASSEPELDLSAKWLQQDVGYDRLEQSRKNLKGERKCKGLSFGRAGQRRHFCRPPTTSSQNNACRRCGICSSKQFIIAVLDTLPACRAPATSSIRTCQRGIELLFRSALRRRYRHPCRSWSSSS